MKQSASLILDKICTLVGELAQVVREYEDGDFCAPPVLDPRFASPPAMKDDGVTLDAWINQAFATQPEPDDDHDTLRPEAPTPEVQEAWEETKETIAKCFEIAHMADGTDQAATDLRDAGGETVCADVLQLLRRSGGELYAHEIAKRLESETKDVSAALKRLINSGHVTSTGERRGTKYQATSVTAGISVVDAAE